MPDEPKGAPSGASESLKEWTARNLANHARRAALFDAEGKLLRTLAELAEKQGELNAAIEAFDAVDHEGPEEFDAQMDRHALDSDLLWLEIGLVGRLGANQDAQQSLLEELVEEVSEEEARELNDRLDRTIDDARPRRGPMKLVYDRDDEERSQRETAEREITIDRLLRGEQAWPKGDA